MNRFILTLLLIATPATPLWAIERNVAGQKLTVMAFDSATGRPKTGDAANITAKIRKDGGSSAALTDTSATETSATDYPGQYEFDLAQAETNAIALNFGAKSSTSGVDVYPIPTVVFTTAPNYSALSVNARGVVTAGAPLSDRDLPFSFKRAKCQAWWDAEYSTKWETDTQTGTVENSDTVGWLENLADAAHPFTMSVSAQRPQYLASTGSVSGSPCLVFAGGSPIDAMECENTLLNDNPNGAQTIWMVVENNGNGPVFCKTTSSQLERYLSVVLAAGGTTENGTVRGDLVQVGNTAGSNGQGPGEVVDNRTYVISITDTPVQLGNGTSTASTTRLNRRTIRMNGSIVFDEVGMPPVHDTATDAYLGYNPSRGITPGLFYFHSLAIFRGELSDAELNELGAMAKRRWKVSMADNAPQPPPSGLELQVIGLGDSNMEGSWSYGTNFLQTMKQRLGPRNLRVPYNLGVFGHTIAQTDVTNIGLLRSGGMTVAIYQPVTNSLGSGVSPATAWAAAKVQINSLLAQGVDKVIIWQPTDRTSAFTGGMDSASYAAAKAAYISLMDADAATYPKWSDSLDFTSVRAVVYPCGEDANYTFNGNVRDMGVSGATNASTDTDWWTDGAHAGPSLQEFHGWNQADMIRVMMGDKSQGALLVEQMWDDWDAAALSSRIPDALVDGRLKSRTESIATGAITNDSIATAAFTLDRFSGVFPANFPSLGVNASGHISRVTLADTITTYMGNTPQTGDSFARIGATGSGLTSLASQASVNTIDDFLDTEIAAILADTNELQTDWMNSGRLDQILDYQSAGIDTIQGQIVAYFASIPDTAAFNARTLPSAEYATAAGVTAVPGNVWGSVTRTLTSGSNIVLAKGTGITGFNDLDAAGVRGAVGLSSANLDAQLSGIPAATWANSTRVLTAGTNIVLAKGTGITGLNDLDAAGVRTAIGMASADLDVQLDAIEANAGLDAAGVRAAIGLSSANLDIQLADLPTLSELDDALGDISVELSPEDIQDIVDGVSEGFTVSAAYVDDKHTWRFEETDDLTAINTIYENDEFDGLVMMSFNKALPPNTTISSVVTVSAAVASTGSPVTTELTLGAPALSTNKIDVLVPVQTAEDGRYICTFVIITTDSQTVTRKGRLEIR